MKEKIRLISVLGLFFLWGQTGFAQQQTVSPCNELLQPPFISDGQQYKAVLKGTETGRFNATFYGQSTYRIVCCSNLPDNELVFSLYDQENNLLFSNKNHAYSPYWDFAFESTLDCSIELKLKEPPAKPYEVFMLIGFRKEK